MKTFLLLIIACMLFTGCVVNSNIAWRGQTDTYKYDFSATTDGKITNSPSATKGDSRIDAQKEYTDSFKTDAKVATGDGAKVNNVPTQEEQLVAPVVKPVAPTNTTAPTQEQQPTVESVTESK